MLEQLISDVRKRHMSQGWYLLDPAKELVSISCICGWDSGPLKPSNPRATANAFSDHVNHKIVEVLLEVIVEPSIEALKDVLGGVYFSSDYMTNAQIDVEQVTEALNRLRALK